MATALQILKGTFGVKTITPTDPGIIKLAELRSGVYPEISPNPITISPTEEVLQLTGKVPDTLAQAARSGALDTSSHFLDVELPRILTVVTGAVGAAGGASEFLQKPPTTEGETTWPSGTTSYLAFRDSLIQQARQLATPLIMGAVSSQVPRLRSLISGLTLPPILARLTPLRGLATVPQALQSINLSWPPLVQRLAALRGRVL